MKIKQKNTGKLVNNSLKPIATITYSIPGLRLIFRTVPGPQPLSPNSATHKDIKKTPKSLEQKWSFCGKVAQPRVTSDSRKPPIMKTNDVWGESLERKELVDRVQIGSSYYREDGLAFY